MTKQYDLFNRFTELGVQIGRLGSIVQNELPDDVEIPDEEIKRWNYDFNECINALNKLQDDTISLMRDR